MKEKWLIAPNEIVQKGKNDNLIYFIGDEGQPPEMAVLCYRRGEDMWEVIGEDAEGHYYFSVTARNWNLVQEIDNAVEKVRNLYISANEVTKEQEEDEDEEIEDIETEIEDEEFYCVNPFCSSYGRIYNPKIDEFGEVVCPDCGEELVLGDDLIEEVDKDDDDFDYREIAVILMVFILNNCTIWGMELKDVVDEIYEYGITSSELQNLLKIAQDEMDGVISY